MVEIVEDLTVYKEKGNEGFKKSESDGAIKWYTKAIKWAGSKRKDCATRRSKNF